MKPKKALRNFLLLAGSSLLAISYTHGADLTWDNNANGTASDGNGTWLNANQWLDAGSPANWNNATPDNAIIGSGGTGGTITLGAVSAGTVLLDNFGGTYTLSGTSLNQTGGITVGSTAGNVTINSVISGAGGVTMAGTGTLTLSNVSRSFTGSLNIENGRVFTNAGTPLANQGVNSALGAGTTIVLGGSGTTGRLSIRRDAGVSSNRNITLAAGGTGEIQFGNNNDTNFQITNADRNLTLSGQISGSGNFVKLGGAAVVLSGNNNYTGTTTVNEGQLRLNNANALSGGIGATGGTTALTINGNGTINVGATIGLTAASGNFLRGLGTGADQFQITGGVSGFDAVGSARQVIVNNDAAFELQWGTSNFNPSEFLLGSHSAVATQAITVQNNIDLNGATRTVRVNSTNGNAISTLSGDIRTSSGTAGLIKTGVGTLVLSGANTYNGATTINQGTLRISNAATFTNTSEINLAFGARLEVSAANANLTNLVTGGGVPTGSFLRYSSAQTAAGSGNGPGTIFGTVEINANNVNPDYTLDFGGGSTLQNLVTATYTSPITLSGNASINASQNTRVFTLNTGGITSSTAGAKTLNLTGSFTGANTINSVIGNGSGTIAVNKTGNGSWTLTGANTYTGATTVSAGTLTLSGANGSIGSSAVTMNGGTLTIANTGAANNGNRLSDSAAFTMNGGTLNFNNTAGAFDYSESAGTLTLTGGANTVAIQQAAVGQTSTLTFAGLSRTGGVLNFTGAGLGTAADPRSTINFTSAPTLTNGIIGTWATVNGLGYATLDGSNNVVLYDTFSDVNRGTAGTKSIADGATTDVRIIQSGALANITLGATTTNVRSILNSVSGGTGATTIAIGAGETLRVGSINSVPTTAALTIGTAVDTGTLTAATAGGNLLLINSSTAANFANANNNMTINSVIADNTSASSVTKDGAGVLRLTGTNTYSGGTIINAGHLAIKSDANLGAAGTGITFNGSGALSFGNHPATGNLAVDLGTRDITINNNAVAGLYHNWANGTTTISGDITGDGGIVWGRDPVLTFNGGDGFQRAFLLSHNNTFTGPLTIGVGNENIGVGNSGLTFNSIGNSSNRITLNRSSLALTYGSGAIADLTLDRPIVLGDTSGTLRNLSAFALTYNGPLLTSGSGARTLNLGGTGAGLSTFGGDIADGAGQQVGVTKLDGGTWALSGDNSYSGLTFINAGTLAIQGKSAMAADTGIRMFKNTTLSLRMDDAGVVNLGNTMDMTANDTNSGITSQYTIDVRNNGGATTGSTLVLGNVDFNGSDQRPGRQINVTGANGYGLQIGDVALSTAILGTAAGGPQRFNPTSASLTITGTIRQVDGNTGASATDNNLYLGGLLASGNNLVSGNIMDAADFPTNPNATALNITKGDTSTWTLSGDNSYTGTTTVSGGTLEIGGSGTLGNVSAGVGSYAGNISIASTSSGRLVYNSSSTQTLGGVVSGAGAVFVEDGTLTLTNTNTYTGDTTVNGGTLLVNGSTAAGSAVSVASGATLGGTGTIGGSVNVSGQLSPGASIESLVTGALTMASGSTFVYEAANNSATGADLLGVNGALSLTDVNLDLSLASAALSSGSWTVGNKLTLISYSGSAITSGFVGYDDDTNYTFGSNVWTFNYDDTVAGANFASDLTGSNFVTLTAFTVIPEPSSAALLGTLGAMLLLRRRR